jgi:hypothetical protein
MSCAVYLKISAAFVVLGLITAFFFSNANYLSAQTSGLIAHWTFDEGSGTTAADSSGNGHNGSLTNGASFVGTGKIGGAISFDGVDDYVRVEHSDSLSLNGELTFSAWVNNSELSWLDTIISKGERENRLNYWFSTIDSNISLGVFNRTWLGSDTAGTSLLPNTWYHVAVTFNNNADSAFFYVDGTQVASLTFDANPITNSEALYIGRSQYTTEYWKGMLDEIRIYNRALSASEVKAIYNETPSKEQGVPPIFDVSELELSLALSYGINITRSLELGMVGSDIILLQKHLNSIGFILASSGPGSPGNETTYYGSLTQDAIRRFQCARGVVCSGDAFSTGYGRVGPKTREALEKI